MSRFMRILVRSGAFLTNPFYPERGYRRPRRGDARNDFGRVVGDMRRIGADMTKVANAELDKYVRQ